MTPRKHCYGNLYTRPGVRSYGFRSATERYDVYCYVGGLNGKHYDILSGSLHKTLNNCIMPKLCVFSFNHCCLPGEVFFASDYDSFSYEEAVQHCQSLNSTLATPGQLYAAWKQGFDKCNPGWLMDRSVRFPITIPKSQCGGGLVGVHTIHAFPNQTGFPDEHSRYDAYCFTGRNRLGVVY